MMRVICVLACGVIAGCGSSRGDAEVAAAQTVTLDPNWSMRYGADVTYTNQTDLPVAVHSNAELTRQIGSFLRGEGGVIQTCVTDTAVCQMRFGDDQTGWVKMGAMDG